jgi:hypothetical protein
VSSADDNRPPVGLLAEMDTTSASYGARPSARAAPTRLRAEPAFALREGRDRRGRRTRNPTEPILAPMVRLGWATLALLAVGCTSPTGPPPSSPSSMSFSPARAAEHAPPAAVLVTTLLPEDPSRQRDTLENEEDHVLCVLPCTAWVEPVTRLHVQVDEGGSPMRVDVPIAEAANATVLVEPKRGHPGAGPWLIGGAVVPFAIGAFLLTFCSEINVGPDKGGEPAGFNCAMGVLAASVGVAMVAAGVVFMVTGRHPQLKPIEGTDPRSTPRAVITPAGVGVSF